MPQPLTVPAPLPAPLQREVDALTDAANELAETGDFRRALGGFEAALELFPAPVESWAGAAAVLGAIADMQFSAGEFSAAQAVLERAASTVEGAESPWLSLRLGQIYFELEDARAERHLAHALSAGGPELFDNEDPKYFDFISARVPPPAGCESWGAARLG